MEMLESTPTMVKAESIPSPILLMEVLPPTHTTQQENSVRLPDLKGSTPRLAATTEPEPEKERPRDIQAPNEPQIAASAQPAGPVTQTAPSEAPSREDRETSPAGPERSGGIVQASETPEPDAP